MTGKVRVAVVFGGRSTEHAVSCASAGLILSDMILTLPFTIWTLTTFMRTLPKELEEAAVLDGAGPWTVLLRVFLPLLAPALATTGLLAFIPNIGAFTSGVLMVAVGFSAGTHQGFWAIGTYLLVQTFDGYVVIPMVARRTVDLPPALTLSSQILASTLFGVIGLTLADPMVAMIKVALERESELAAKADARRQHRKWLRNPDDPRPVPATGEGDGS